jgi:serine protease Do
MSYQKHPQPGLKKHHKILIGSFTSLIIIALVVNSVFLYLLFVKVNLTKTSLEQEINNLQIETDLKINEITTSLLETKNSVTDLGSSLKTELNELKASASSDFSGVIEDAIQSVVTIKTDVSQGTGFIIDAEGYVITNAHVLSGARSVNAITSQQKQILAELIGYDLNLDLALLKIPGNYQEIELGNSDNIQIGEKVIAIGNPLGLQFSVSEGIVSAVNRPGSNGIEAYIQTDAALNPGNSGGPLINKQGEVIGINNFKVGGGESLGFALESNYIKDTINDISLEKLNQTLIQ